LFENDTFRRAFLAEVALGSGRSFLVSPDCRFADIREARFDVLADMVAQNLDTEALTGIIEGHGEHYGPVRISST